MIDVVVTLSFNAKMDLGNLLAYYNLNDSKKVNCPLWEHRGGGPEKQWPKHNPYWPEGRNWREAMCVSLSPGFTNLRFVGPTVQPVDTQADTQVLQKILPLPLTREVTIISMPSLWVGLPMDSQTTSSSFKSNLKQGCIAAHGRAGPLGWQTYHSLEAIVQQRLLQVTV